MFIGLYIDKTTAGKYAFYLDGKINETFSKNVCKNRCTSNNMNRFLETKTLLTALLTLVS